MDSLLDDVDSLIAPDLSADATNWCENCQSLRQEIKRLQDEQLQNFGKLKQKIISTDLLIKKFKSKCDDYDVQCKRTEEANKRADKYQRQTEILETQLKASLLDTEPLRKTAATIEVELRQKNAELQTLKDRVVAAESAQKQYEHLSRANSAEVDRLEAEKKELTARIKYLEAGRVDRGAAKEFKSEISNLKKENTVLNKNEKRLKKRLSTALGRIERLNAVIKEGKFSPARSRRTVSGSPLKSPDRSPRTDAAAGVKSSPRGVLRTRTASEKSSMSGINDTVKSENEEKLGSDSSSSSSDSDDSSSSDDSDDAGSLMSVKWTFSPVTKCLSPLPPSPACFVNRKHGGLQPQASLTVEEDGMVSDIADELEQQLLQDDDNQTGDDELQKTLTEDDSFMIKDDRNNIDGTERSSVENTASEIDETRVPFNSNELEQLQDCKEVVTEPEINKNNLNAPCKPAVTAETEECIQDEFGDRNEITEQERAPVDIECLNSGTKNESEITLKEKLANSMEIISPTASSKRIGQTPLHTMSGSKQPEKIDSSKEVLNVNNTELDKKSIYSDKKKKTPPVRRSVRIKTLSESEHSQPECDVTVAGVDIDKTGIAGVDTDKTVMKNSGFVVEKEKNENNKLLIFGGAIEKGEKCEIKKEEPAKHEFGRNDTEEFTPEMTNNTPTYSDLETEMNFKLVKVDPADKTHTSDKNDNLEYNCDNPKISIETVTKDAISELKLDANLSDTCTNSSNAGVILETPDKDKKQLVSKLEETIVKGELEHKDKVSVNLDKNLPKPAVKKAQFGAQNFIKFQKSSAGTLSNEIEEFGYLNDYEVLSREDSVNSDSKSSKVRLNPNFKKNVKRRLRKKCKYRDLDAQQNENVTHRNDVNDDDVVKDKIKNLATAQTAPDKESTCGKSQTEILEKSVKSEEDTEFKTQNSTDTNGKLKPTRQLSTGFQVNNSVLERSLSNESSGSVRTSPLRLLHMETGICETITEEDEGKDVKKIDEHILEKVKNPRDNSNLIFGVEDLLADFAPIEEHTQDTEHDSVHTLAKPFCDRAAVTNCSTGLQNYDLKLNTKSLSLLDDESNKPGCSYLYKESNCSESAKGSAFSKVIKERNKDIASLSRSSSSSMSSLDRSSPVSPLSISPFNFLCPVSPLPPSPVREIDRKSLEQATLDQDQQRESENLIDNYQLDLDIQKTETINDNTKCEETDQIPKLEQIPELEEKVLVEDEKRESKLNDSDEDKKELAFVDGEGNKNMSDMVLIEIYPLEDTEEVENINGLELGPETNISDNIEAETINKSIETRKITDVAETESVVKTKEGKKKDHLESPKKPLKYSSLKVESLMLSPVPHMISPVRSPKGRLNTTLKASLNLNLQDKTKPCAKNDKKQKRGQGIKSTNEFDKGTKSKQVSETLVEKTETIGPRITRSRASIDNSSLDVCARKSGKTTVRRKSMSVERKELNVVPKQEPSDAGESKIAKQNLDNAKNKKGNVAIATQDILISDPLPNVSTRGNVLKNGDTVTPWSEMKSPSKLESDVMVDEKGDSLVLQELPVGQDNLAFKRKSRVAHKPNTQPLKPPKIMVIEAPRLPPVSGRKRKSLDRNTETKEKKPCEDSKLLKEKPAETISSEDSMLLAEEKSVETVSSKEDTKLMQGFLKSSELAESFVSKYVTKNNSDDAGIRLLSTCLECLGKVRTDSIDVVHKTCISDEYLHLEGELPYLSDVEKKAVHLIQYLISQTHMKLSEAAVMRNVWNRLFTRDVSPHFIGKMAQFRVFTALCALQGDLVLVRTMLYHMLTCGYMNIVSFVVPVVSVWPEALRKDPADQPDKVVSNSMVLVMEEIITKSLRSQVSKVTEKPVLILQKMCLWSGKGNDADALVKLLVTRILAITDSETPDKGELFETTKALELLCDHQNWRWFKDRFINRFGLQTAANKYTCKTIQKPVSADYMGALLKVTSHCMHTLCSDITERDYIRIIENWLMPILSHKPGNNIVQHYCLETLLELTPLYPTCLAMIQQWFLENKYAINRGLKARLEELRTQYLNTFGLICRPFFAD